MVFQQSSLRTRVFFKTGMIQLDGEIIYLTPIIYNLGEKK